MTSEVYEKIISCVQPIPLSFLSTCMSSWNTPLKIICFSQLILYNRILTCDTLIKKGMTWYGCCALCKSDMEYFLHLFIHFPFTMDIWKEVFSLLEIQVGGDNFSTTTRIFSWEHQSKVFRTLPLFTFQGIWCSMNEFIFEGIIPEVKLSSIHIVSHFMESRPCCPKESSTSTRVVDLLNLFLI